MYKRVVIAFFIICLFFVLSFMRIIMIQQDTVNLASLSSHSISLEISQTRGMIYDRNMEPLVNCDKTEYIAVKPLLSSYEAVKQFIPQAEREAVFDEISNGRIAAFESDKKLSDLDAINVFTVKRYSDNGLCVHTVGYINSDSNGVCGIEKYYDDFLNSEKGSLKVVCQVDARMNALEGEQLKAQSDNYNSKAGIVLTVDKEIQQICEDALTECDIKKGAVVVLDVKTSQIRAMASAPEFSQNNPALSLNNEDSPFINRAITPYAVGSIFKVVVSAAALESGISENLSYNCTGNIQIGSQSFGCHKKTGHGVVDMFSATALSCNPYFINIALMTDKQAICEMAGNLGLGKSIELCDGWYAQGGILPSAEKLVSKQDIANFAFGQGEFSASALQMAAVYATIANNGVYRVPSLMQSIVNKEGTETIKAELPASRRVMSENTADIIKKALLKTAEEGSGKAAKPENITVAGKTATAQSGEYDKNGNEILRAWFCGFFPYEKPEYAVAVIKENGEGGAVDCAPIFRYIAERIKTDV